MTLPIKQLTTTDPNFWTELEQLLAWDAATDEPTLNVVREIIAKVRRDGDSALLDYTQRFDRRELQNIQEIVISQARLQQALDHIEPQQRLALENAAQRIRDYHQHQVQQSWQYTEADGTVLGQQVTALEKVGLYVPGGKATYPSSVLMNAIPAKVAGVETLVMVVPAPDGVLNEMVLAAAAIAGVDQVFAIGGAQAVAALAYGTATVPKVDKIVGPGNIYVATAKSLVFGAVGIDMIAGPSEILVICDGKTDPDWIAMDLFSQAEHDELARSVLLTPDPDFITAVQNSIERLLPSLPRAEIVRTSLTTRGLLIQVTDLEDAVNVANFIAPEHLELSVEDAPSWAKKIRHAGAIFMGRYTAEAIGDYCAGPNHVLPTARTARFSSPLGVYDFQKRSSLIMCSPSGADTLGRLAATLAYSEGLQAHAHSAEYRLLSK